MAVILALDTSAMPVSCALWQEDKLLALNFAHKAIHHSQTLMPMVQHTLASVGMTADQVDAYAVSVGPGSFTGVRIGVSSVKGLAFAQDKPCVAVSTLEAMARAVAELPMEALICCVMDARCNQVYTASFSQERDGRQQRVSSDEAISIDELKKRLKNVEKPILLVGDGAELCYNAMKGDISLLYLAPQNLRFQSAACVAAVAAQKLVAGETVSSRQLEPLYLRLPQAERELRAKQQSANE